MNIRTLIVDDEPLARQKLCAMLEKETDIQLVGECDNGEKALAMIRVTGPELVFLDINMPGMMGTEVAAALTPAALPQIVFVSAHNQFALTAFDLNILDYLLKPFDYSRLQKTLVKFRQNHLRQPSQQIDFQMHLLVEQLSARPKYMDRVMIRSGDDILIVKTEMIDWIEAAGNYVYLHTGGKARLLRETMNNLEARLDPNKFIRIHRSQIVNIERIKKMQPSSHGEYVIIMGDNSELTLTRTYRDNLLGRFEISA